jgi:hypothetical protein
MATAESIAIRRELALERIQRTIEMLSEREGLRSPSLAQGAEGIRDANLIFAKMLENIAQWLEDYAGSAALSDTQEVVDVSPPPRPRGKR